MDHIRSWKDLAAEAGRRAYSANPLDEMQKAGLEMAPALRRVFEGRSVKPKVAEDRLRAALSQIEHPPSIQTWIGRADLPALRTKSSAGLTVTFDASVVNDVAKAFFDWKTYEREVAGSLIRKVLSIADLRAFCNGVPDGDANVGDLVLRSEVRLEVPGNGEIVVAHQSVSLRITGSQPASLDGTFSFRFPLAIDVVGNITVGARALSELVLSLAVDASSPVQPKSASDKQQLLDRLGESLRERLDLARLKYFVESIFPLTGRFKNTSLQVANAAGFAHIVNGRPLLTFGANLAPSVAAPSPADLQPPAPIAPANVRYVVDESFATNILKAAIDSGDLENFANEKLANKVEPFGVSPIRIRGGRVRMTPGKVSLVLDGTWVDACSFGKDLKFRATADVFLRVVDGEISAQDMRLDIDLDNTDALVCMLLSALFGPFGILVNAIVLGIVAAINPTPDDKSRPALLEPALPGTEVRLRTEVTAIEMLDGQVVAHGTAHVVPNETDWFVYLQINEGLQPAFAFPSRLAGTFAPNVGGSAPLPGAKVALLELDNPAPAGDDVAIPNLEEDVRFTGKFLITTVRSYAPRADQFLAEATSDAHGRVRFRVLPNGIGGQLTETKIREALTGGEVLSQVTTRRLIRESAPDFAVSVAAADGTIMATRLLTQRNASGRHAGTLEEPLVVLLPARLPTFERIS
jgi:hypothetical protein